MYLWAQCSVISIILFGSYRVVMAEEIRAIHWPTVILIGLLAGSGIVLPLQLIFDPSTGDTKRSIPDSFNRQKTEGQGDTQHHDCRSA